MTDKGIKQDKSQDKHLGNSDSSWHPGRVQPMNPLILMILLLCSLSLHPPPVYILSVLELGYEFPV